MKHTPVAVWVALLVLATPLARSAAARSEEPGESPASVAEDADLGGPAHANVVRAIFTTSIQRHEPQDQVDVVDTTRERVMFFSELSGYAGHTIRHRWIYNGRVMAEIPFEVSGQRWRVFSSKKLDPAWLGEWTVVLVDEQDRILARKSLSYVDDADRSKDKAKESLPAAPAPRD